MLKCWGGETLNKSPGETLMNLSEKPGEAPYRREMRFVGPERGFAGERER